MCHTLPNVNLDLSLRPPLSFDLHYLRMRLVLLTVINISSGCASIIRQRDGGGSNKELVRVEGTSFIVDGEPYRYLGTNFWYGLNLASAGPEGDRERLNRELDRLSDLGLDNLRIMAGSEGPDSEPWRVVPALKPSPGEYAQELLDGLDYLLWAMGRRGMRAVVCLTNFWFWSGGMAQYLAWNGAGAIPYPLNEGGDWHEYQVYTASFYTNDAAVEDLERHIVFMLDRVNPYTGFRYRDDPTIMSWELANEPRGMNDPEAMRDWIHQTAGLIKSVDPNHLVATGSEGDTDLPNAHGTDFVLDHVSPNIDYMTVHLWVENWGWYDPDDAEGTYSEGELLALEYLRRHIVRAREAGKPMVLEEFGIGRDRANHDPSGSVELRNMYYARVLDELVASSVEGPVAGANFWAWGGEGRPTQPFGSRWRAGDPLIGDPPHEPQGWYSVYDSDESTLAILRRYAQRLRRR